MHKYVCTRAFQSHGTMIHSGTVISIDEETAKKPFVASHVRRVENDGSANGAMATTQVGQEKEERRPPVSSVGAEDPSQLTDDQIKSALAELGVSHPRKMSREDLLALYIQAKEAVAGSPSEPNRPKETGR